MRAQIARVVAGTVDQCGLSAPQELHPHQVHAGRADDAAVMTDHALAVENRQLQPGIIRPIAGGPDDRLDPALDEVHAERGCFLDTGRRQTIRRLHRVVEAVRARPFVDEVEQPAHLEIGERAHVAQRPGKLRLAVFGDAGETADQPHADVGEGVEVQGRAVGCAGKLQRGNPSRPRDVVHLVVALVEHAGGVHPPFQILAAIDARRPDVLSDRQRDRSPRALELVRDLGAARGSAHDQDAAVGELARIAIGLGGQRRDRRRHAGGEARHPRDVARTRGQHDGPAPPVAPVRAHEVSGLRAAHRGDGRMGSHRSRDRLRIGRDEVDDLRQRPIAIGIVAVIAKARQPALPVGGQQPQRVPSLGAPAYGRPRRAPAGHDRSNAPRGSGSWQEPRAPRRR